MILCTSYHAAAAPARRKQLRGLLASSKAAGPFHALCSNRAERGVAIHGVKGLHIRVAVDPPHLAHIQRVVADGQGLAQRAEEGDPAAAT